MTVLELRNVSRHYPAGQAGPVVVLDGVNLRLDAGQRAAVVGPSGSGKSTLLNLIGALDQPSAGEVLIQGRDVAALGERQRALLRNRCIGFVFQAHHLLPQCSVIENVLVPTLVRGSTGEDRSRAERLLEHVGLADRLAHRPGQLSGGECQRVAVVRALINQPRLLLADEPTGSLDRAHASRLVELLIDVSRQQGVALVMVSHATELAERLESVYELRDGRLHRTRGDA